MFSRRAQTTSDNRRVGAKGMAIETMFKEVNGMMWPDCDTDCWPVVFNSVKDLDKVLLFCKRFEVAVQAGGNCGVWPKKLAQHFKTVYTFEPESNNFRCLVHNCDEVNIIKMQAALGYDWAPVAMVYPEGLRNMGACHIEAGGNIPVISIDTLRLNACDFIQLDTEGYEREAIRGALRTIGQFQPVLMIEDKGLSEKYGMPKDWTEDVLTSLGYRRAGRVENDVVFIPEKV